MKRGGWYRYKLTFGTTKGLDRYDISVYIQKSPRFCFGGEPPEDASFTREEAKEALRYIGGFIERHADFRTLREEF